MYKKIYEQGNKRQTGKENTHLIHLWTDEGYEKIEWENHAYRECREDEATAKGLNGEPLVRTHNWDRNTNKLHFGDISAHQKFLIEKYGTDDRPSTTCREVFFDIECEMGGALTVQYIREAPKPLTSISMIDVTTKTKICFVVDKSKNITESEVDGKIVVPCADEEELILRFIDKFREFDPEISISPI